ncbi:MAG: hypothetical protein RL226_550 [Bacteroidota bacterium]|jgi:UDP-glucose 4-epimerase
MAKVLVTGGAGFIASALAHRLALESNEVVIVDNLLTGKKSNIPSHPAIRFVKCDVNDFNDLAGVFYAGGFDFVFHYAALVGVQRTLDNPVKVLHDMDGIRNVLQLSKATGVKRVFFASSSEVYGEPFEIPQNERTTPLNSRLPYAIVKNAGEAWLRAYQKEYGLDFTIFRFFNTYGPQQSDDFVISRFMKAALANEPIHIYGDGQQTRTFCYIDDNIEACYRIFSRDLYINDVVNIGADEELTILHVANVVKEICKSTSPIVHLPALAEGDMSRRKPDITNMKAVLGAHPRDLYAGLTNLLSAQNLK